METYPKLTQYLFEIVHKRKIYILNYVMKTRYFNNFYHKSTTQVCYLINFIQ